MVSTSSLLYCAWIVRYKGHKGSEYNIDSALTHNDACVVSGSEDGKIYFWELVEVISVVREGGLCDWCVPTVECCGTDNKLKGSCVVYSYLSKPCLSDAVILPGGRT